MEQEFAHHPETASSVAAPSVVENSEYSPAVVSIAQVIALTSLSKQTLYREIGAKRFPAPVRLTANRVGWRLAEINAWLGQRELAA